MTQYVDEATAGPVVLDMAAAVAREQAWLSEIDGRIGDGDHGINMGKGFRLAAERLRGEGTFGLAHGLRTLGDTLLSDIGGSMGPLYGTCFTEMANAISDAGRIDAAGFGAILDAGAAAVADLGGAKPGDKTLVDVIEPARSAFHLADAKGGTFAMCLAEMKEAATLGLESTRDMVARVGRASRLGERSRGTLDPGAASCSLLLGVMADRLTTLLQEDTA